MDEIKMEREIKEMLHQCADELHAPDSMQTRVKFALNNAPARKRHLWSKRFVAVAAVAAIAVTGAFAAGGMGGIFSKGWSDQRLDLSSTQAHLADAGVVLTLPDKIGEYTYSYGSDVDTTARNSVGETEKIAEVENLTVTEQDIEEEFESMAKQYEMEVSKVKELVPVEELTESLKTRKAVKLIVDSAVAVVPKAEEKTEE